MPKGNKQTPFDCWIPCRKSAAVNSSHMGDSFVCPCTHEPARNINAIAKAPRGIIWYGLQARAHSNAIGSFGHSKIDLIPATAGFQAKSFPLVGRAERFGTAFYVVGDEISCIRSQNPYLQFGHLHQRCYKS